MRNSEGKCQHDFQAEVNAGECHRVHESYELKWAGNRDADDYSKKAAKEQMDNPDALIAKDREILAASENLAKKEQSHAEIEIQASKAIRRKNKEGSSDELISKDKEILAAEEKLKRKKGAYSFW